LSHDILKNLLDLLPRLDPSDRQNLYFSVANILKGLKESKVLFLSCGGASSFLAVLLSPSPDTRCV